MKVGVEGNDRGWDIWISSPIQWTWVWSNSGGWWRTGKPRVLLGFVGSQRVGLNQVTEQQQQWDIRPAVRNCQTLMKDTEGYTSRWKGTPCSWIGKINIFTITNHFMQSNSPVQCNFHQNTNGTFPRTRTHNFKICMEMQKT